MLKRTFDCHLCDVKKTTYSLLENYSSDEVLEMGKSHGEYISATIYYQICKCNSCNGIFYWKIRGPRTQHGEISGLVGGGNMPTQIEIDEEPLILFMHPISGGQLPTFIDKLIRSYYREAVDCLAIGAFDAASMMFRKCVYRICAIEKIPTKVGKKYLRAEERIKMLKLPDEVASVLKSAKGIGDDAAHLDQPPYSPEILYKLKDALKIVFQILYENKEILKEFHNKYTREKQTKKSIKTL